MKKYFYLLLLSVLLASCTPQQSNYLIYSNYIDYSRFSNKGFVITEGVSVGYDYQPIGRVCASVFPGMASKSKGEISKEMDKVKEEMMLANEKRDDEKIKELQRKYVDLKREYDNPTKKHKYASIDDAIEALYKRASLQGADGIIEFKTNHNCSEYDKTSIITVTGIAIKKRN